MSVTDLLPGFSTLRLGGPGPALNVRVAGEGPPVVLLHGYPQTHLMWHGIAPRLAGSLQVVLVDLPGYGESDAPPVRDLQAASKRAWARSVMTVMASLGHQRFAVVGHDRGARVGYRLALDHPEVVDRLAVLDILPTVEYWERLDRAAALGIHHWTFLAQQEPLPETLIGTDPRWYFDQLMHGQADRLFGPGPAEAYRSAMARQATVHASCQDYRAGATVDVEHDLSDRDAGRRVTAPTLALWGASGVPTLFSDDPLSVWREWAVDVRGESVDAGHFLCEERPEEVAERLVQFLHEEVHESA